MKQHPPVDTLVAEKVEQAVGILQELNIDAWLTFAQETMDGGDPAYAMIMGERDLGNGLLLITRQGDKIVVVGGLDFAIPASTGVWKKVLIHPGNWNGLLVDVLRSLDPQQIAINYSLTNPKADGLSFGKYLRLQKALENTPFLDRLVSAHEVVSRLRARKTAAEIASIREPIAITDAIFLELDHFLKPGITGHQIYDFILDQVARRGVATAWSRDHCPVVTVGPVPAMGHTPPGDEITQRGHTLQVDFGVKHKGFCSDFQRMWYFLEEAEKVPPPEVQHLFNTIREGIDVIIANLHPGVPVWKPTEEARQVLLRNGYPSFQYGVGHQLGRATHDGGQGLSPRGSPGSESLIEAGNVFTTEGLETRLEGRGWISLEEDVLVTDHGPLILTQEQRQLWLIR